MNITPASLTPQQPDLDIATPSVARKVVAWNSISPKNMASIWQFETGPGRSGVEIFPDNLHSFVFVGGQNPNAYLLGPHIDKWTLPLQPDSVYFIFKPHSLMSVKRRRIPVGDLAGQCAPLGLLLDDLSIVEDINRAGSLEAKTRLFIDFANRHLLVSEKKDALNLVDHMKLSICQRRGADRIERMEKYTGYSGRYLRRVFREQMGFSIKNFSTVIRFQSVLRMLRGGSRRSVLEAALANNYCDQSHLTNAFKKFAGLTPQAFLKRYGRLHEGVRQ